MARIEAPSIDCPKCGERVAFMDAHPRYTTRLSGGLVPFDNLAWTCKRCGYELMTDTADKSPEPAWKSPTSPRPDTGRHRGW
jgi:hypothetical protein